ncbi:UDP-glucose/GDP-mannose dehydrogenase family, NAD binding domain [Pragia fontium DSM 5563 = ATCC 49100]|uniref:UDP-glucose/GDP-mannose dehydrogenase family, NAD binding domain n=1 Tax=Pragia fontium DSM 5563 = ATCC 49100 TaxID=1122977 RepID=A0AAJ4W8J2_9GAMM|nr:UDP-glucose/GDP-mannose dehydrogenase family, NAD binding domain [Pragia fontium DSM 5563 = ATCC 49100]
MATLNKEMAYQNADYVIFATPTDYDTQCNSFNTQTVDAVIRDVLLINPDTIIIIKSTVPIDYTKRISSSHQTNNIIFSPEFFT